MIILTAGHTGAGTGAQCITTQFDEGAENIWLRNRVAEILTNKYGLVVLVDDDKASLKLLVKELSRDTACRVLSVNRPNERLKPIPISADTIEITLHSRDAACCVRRPPRNARKHSTNYWRTLHAVPQRRNGDCDPHEAQIDIPVNLLRTSFALPLIRSSF